MIITDEYEREETRQVYVDLNNNIEVSVSKNMIILSRRISEQSDSYRGLFSNISFLF